MISGGRQEEEEKKVDKNEAQVKALTTEESNEQGRADEDGTNQAMKGSSFVDIDLELDNEQSDQETGKEKRVEKNRSCGASVKAWLIKWHLPLLLLFVFFIGFAAPTPGTKANDVRFDTVCFGDVCVWNTIGSVCVTVIFFLSGLKLKTEAIRNAITAWQASLFGLVSILFITPCIGFALATASFHIEEFAMGLALFFSMPTTLSSGPIIVGQARGNVALALMLTVVSNVIGVFTVPFFVTKSLEIFTKSQNLDDESNGSTTTDIDLDPTPMILKLVFTILIPLIIGKIIRSLSAAVRSFVSTWKVSLKIFSSVLLCLIPWMKVSSSADSLRNVDAASFFYMWFLGIAVHFLFLLVNFVSSKYLLHLELPEEIAVVIVASQKTLPVAMTILEFLPEEVIGAPGLVAVPIIISHLMQILIDSFIAAKYSEKRDKLENLQQEGSGSSSSSSSSSPSSPKIQGQDQHEDQDNAPR